LNGIVHVLKSGGRWANCPADYAPKNTICNRFVRWAERGIWKFSPLSLDAMKTPTPATSAKINHAADTAPVHASA
jgi:hypothetical protein